MSRAAVLVALVAAASASSCRGHTGAHAAPRPETAGSGALAVTPPSPDASAALVVAEPPVDVAFPEGAVRVRALAVGPNRTCAVLADGSVRCWGAAFARYTPAGDYPAIRRPQVVPGLEHVAQVAIGQEHACARRTDGAVYCWGRARFGELGDGTATDHESPVRVNGLDDAVDLAVGAQHTCAVRASGTVVCWGNNRFRQLGSDGQHLAPVAVAGVTGARTVALGANHSCALLADGAVRCWGGAAPPVGVRYVAPEAPICPQPGGVGVAPYHCPPPPEPVTPPVAVRGLTGVVELSAGGAVSCARTRDGRVLCWGLNQGNELGDDTTDAHETPAVVPGLCPAARLAVGEGTACVACVDGALQCWGTNPRSQHLADPHDEPMRLARPAAVPGLTRVVLAASTHSHVCVLEGDGVTRCFGENTFGAAGNGADGFARAPVAVAW